MSQERPPPSNQPAREPSPTETMTRVERTPQCAASLVPERSDSHSSRTPVLPPISAVPSMQTLTNHGARRLPPIQLPQIRDSPAQTSTRGMSIASLLSSDSETHEGQNPQHNPPMHSHTSPSQLQQLITRPVGHSQDARVPLCARPSMSSHYIDGPPMALRDLPASSQMQQQPTVFWRHPTSPLETEYLQHSPASSTHSFSRGYFSSSSEPSPSASVAPPFRTPSQRRFSKPPPFNYNLSIRQQPVAARACGFGERDRRVIDPPPILELKITNRTSGGPEQDLSAMLALHCTLLSEDGKDDETEVPPAHDGMPSTRRLMGTLVASPYQAKDENGIAGTFFVFPDLSCRSPGKYRLRFKLLRVDPMMMTPGAVHGTVASILTDLFAVYTAKDFPGMRASSALLKALRRQGLNVGVKKGSEFRKGSKGKNKKASSSDEDDEEDEDSEVDNHEDRRASRGSGSTESVGDTKTKVKHTKKVKRRKQEP